MFRHVVIVSLVAWVAAGVSLGQGKKREPDLKEREWGEFKFKAYFPEKEPKETKKKLKTNAGDLDQGTMSVDLKDATYSVTVTLLPDTVVRTEAKAVIDGVREGLVGKDGKLESDNSIKQAAGDTPGREILIDFRKNQLKTRILLVENRLYQVSVTGAKAVVAGKTAGEFLRSFEVTK